MCYDFYDQQRGYEDGYSSDKAVMGCPYESKSEIIMYTMGFVDGRRKWYEDHPRKPVSMFQKIINKLRV